MGGILELGRGQSGHLRDAARSFLPGERDPFVHPSFVREFAMRPGSLVEGRLFRSDAAARPTLGRVDSIDGRPPAEHPSRPRFEDLVAISPDAMFRLADGTEDPTLRALDLVSPIGRGQRALIVAPPRSGKTVLLQRMARSLRTNYPDARVLVLLVDERPEEVTDFRRQLPDAEILSSTLDRPAQDHVHVLEISLARVRRLVEEGEDVVVFLDSLTRFARAYNSVAGQSGRTLSGGLDSRAMERPRAFFGSARATEDGGSLTIVATALVDTGSRMDQVIFEEFKGTGNMELVLDRRLADRRIYPAIDFNKSGTRREEELRDPLEMARVTMMRRILAQEREATELLLQRLARTSTNDEFLALFDRAQEL